MAGYQGCSDGYSVPLRVVASNPPPSITPAAGEDSVYLYNTGVQGWQVTAATQTTWIRIMTALHGVSEITGRCKRM